ncbi:MAG: hypothetical protein EON58_00330 [Alphaproteobacteria bacterium]|nr:MAG: hypothetical protein EON58_00330 [Alphaproteobacteria bacterium]
MNYSLYHKSMRLFIEAPVLKAIWMALVYFCNQHGTCWPPIVARNPEKLSLSSVTGLSPRVISKWLKHLAEIGAIQRQQNKHGSIYRLNFAALQESYAPAPASDSCEVARESTNNSILPLETDAGGEVDRLFLLIGEQRALDLLDVRSAKNVPNTSGSISALVDAFEAHVQIGTNVEALADKCIRQGWSSPNMPRIVPPHRNAAGSVAGRTIGSKAPVKSNRIGQYLARVELHDTEWSREVREYLQTQFPKNVTDLTVVFQQADLGLKILCASPVQCSWLQSADLDIRRVLAAEGKNFDWLTVDVLPAAKR